MSVVLNYTTSVEVRRTVAEVSQLLGESGAAAVQVHYVDKEPTDVGFVLTGPHGDRAFTLPVDVDAVHRLLNSRETEKAYRSAHGRPLRPNHRTREQAARVAWRTAQDWLEAQLAMVAAQMVGLDEVMLPFLHLPELGGRTLREAYRDSEQAALTAGAGG